MRKKLLAVLVALLIMLGHGSVVYAGPGGGGTLPFTATRMTISYCQPQTPAAGYAVYMDAFGDY